jgi:hypothetical protein
MMTAKISMPGSLDGKIRSPCMAILRHNSLFTWHEMRSHVKISTARESVLSYSNQPKARLGMLGSSYVGVKETVTAC